MRVVFSAGEASGDAYAAALVQKMRLTMPAETKFEGAGGRRSREAGINVVVDSSKWGVIGIVQAIRAYPRIAGGYYSLKRHLASGKPGLFIPIDYGYANIRLSRHAKRLGWKILYFIPPGSWRKDRQGNDLGEIADEVVTPFPWSEEILAKKGVSVHFWGHPLVQMAAAASQPAQRTGVAVLPGSRLQEVEQNLSLLAEAVSGLDEKLTFAVAPSLEIDEVKDAWSKLGGADAEFTRDVYGCLKSARAALVCSGTATLEAAICSCPSVVFYKVSKWLEIEAKIVKPKFDWVSLPNILLDRGVIPELLQHDATPEALRSHLDELVADGKPRDAQLMAFSELRRSLGLPDCLGKTALRAAEMLDSSR